MYLRLAEQVLAHNKNVMILVPEIALTPQLQQRFAERLGEGVLLMHSGMKDTEREIAWQRLRLGLARVVLGTRSVLAWPRLQLTHAQSQRFRHGQALALGASPGVNPAASETQRPLNVMKQDDNRASDPLRVYSEANEFLGIASWKAGLLQPERLLAPASYE